MNISSLLSTCLLLATKTIYGVLNTVDQLGFLIISLKNLAKGSTMVQNNAICILSTVLHHNYVLQCFVFSPAKATTDVPLLKSKQKKI